MGGLKPVILLFLIFVHFFLFSCFNGFNIFYYLIYNIGLLHKFLLPLPWGEIHVIKTYTVDQIRSDQISPAVVSDSLRPHESQHARSPCKSPTPEVHWDWRPSSQWCHPAISSSVVPFSSCPQSLPASESFPMSPYQGSNLGLLHYRLILYYLSYQGMHYVSTPNPQPVSQNVTNTVKWHNGGFLLNYVIGGLC